MIIVGGDSRHTTSPRVVRRGLAWARRPPHLMCHALLLAARDGAARGPEVESSPEA